jgi:coproporphyrinogen III oxidase-like Fe-S oxidoreductase
LAEAGFAQYEVSAYARPGRQCAHNLNYWRFGDYLGVGAGAHGKLTLPAGIDAHEAASGTVLRRWKLKHPAAWLAHAGTSAAIGGDERIEGERRAFDFMLNALRLVDGFSLDMFEARTGLARGTIAVQLEQARARGWVELEGIHVRPTELGRRFTNDVVSLFL